MFSEINLANLVTKIYFKDYPEKHFAIEIISLYVYKFCDNIQLRKLNFRISKKRINPFKNIKYIKITKTLKSRYLKFFKKGI